MLIFAYLSPGVAARKVRKEMADKVRYPQIPSTVWWGVHAILNKTPNATLDEKFLSIQLGVQPAAAKAYIAELVSVGILTEEFKATPLAMKWRLEGTYSAAVDELIKMSIRRL